MAAVLSPKDGMSVARRVSGGVGVRSDEPPQGATRAAPDGAWVPGDENPPLTQRATDVSPLRAEATDAASVIAGDQLIN